MEIKLRLQKISDAKRFYEILNNPKFLFFGPRPKSIKDEITWLKGNPEKRRKNLEHNFTILYKGIVVGACGIKVDQHRKYIGEIGYFVDEVYWGKGIATKSVRILESIGFNKLNIKRIEVLVNPKNKASLRVAIRNGYKREGLLKKKIMVRGKLHDAYLFGKIKK